MSDGSSFRECMEKKVNCVTASSRIVVARFRVIKFFQSFPLQNLIISVYRTEIRNS